MVRHGHATIFNYLYSAIMDEHGPTWTRHNIRTYATCNSTGRHMKIFTLVVVFGILYLTRYPEVACLRNTGSSLMLLECSKS